MDNHATYANGCPARLQIDTGASMSAIDQKIVRVLGLKHHGSITIATPSSTHHEALAYDIDVVFPDHYHDHHRHIEVIEVPLGDQNIDGLMGRDILHHALFIYYGTTGQFTLAFSSSLFINVNHHHLFRLHFFETHPTL